MASQRNGSFECGGPLGHSAGRFLLGILFGRRRRYTIFTTSLILNFVAAIGLLVREYYTTIEPRMRLQLKFWLFGMGIALPLGLTNLLPAYGIRFYPLGNLASVLWAGIVGYAIVRHRLMDIDVVVAKGLAYVGVSVYSYWSDRLHLSGAAGLGLSVRVHYDFSAAVVVLFFAVGLLFPWLQAATERRVGRSLFRSKVGRARGSGCARLEVVRILDRQRLLSVLCAGIGDAFSIDRVAIYLSEGAGSFALNHVVGLEPSTANIDRDNRLIRLLSQVNDGVLREEVEGGDPATRSSERDDDRKWLGCCGAIPQRQGNNRLSVLGAQRALEAFTAGDLTCWAK